MKSASDLKRQIVPGLLVKEHICSFEEAYKILHGIPTCWLVPANLSASLAHYSCSYAKRTDKLNYARLRWTDVRCGLRLPKRAPEILNHSQLLLDVFDSSDTIPVAMLRLMGEYAIYVF